MDEVVTPSVHVVVGVDSPSAMGGASPMRHEPFTGEVCDISSGDDDAFVVAPSRPVEEVTEAGTSSETGAWSGRREPRTKVVVDRSGVRPSDVPSKRKAGTSPGGSGVKTTPSWRSPGLTWVDAGASPSG